MTLASFSSLSFKTGCFFERFAVAKVWKRVRSRPFTYSLRHITYEKEGGAGTFCTYVGRGEEMAATAGEDKNGGPALYER